ncbi:MAG: hypothetical protein JZD41_03665 [Thermoproteus sp.]|nr:hypothetical protein [Thermoproteus sp.]
MNVIVIAYHHSDPIEELYYTIEWVSKKWYTIVVSTIPLDIKRENVEVIAGDYGAGEARAVGIARALELGADVITFADSHVMDLSFTPKPNNAYVVCNYEQNTRKLTGHCTVSQFWLPYAKSVKVAVKEPGHIAIDNHCCWSISRNIAEMLIENKEYIPTGFSIEMQDLSLMVWALGKTKLAYDPENKIAHMAFTEKTYWPRKWFSFDEHFCKWGIKRYCRLSWEQKYRDFWNSVKVTLFDAVRDTIYSSKNAVFFRRVFIPGISNFLLPMSSTIFEKYVDDLEQRLKS